MDYTTVGAFVLAMLVALVVCLALLTGRTGATDTYTTHFDNVLGVIPGTQLFFEGYPIGQVDRIEPSDDPASKRYRVYLSVEEGWPIPEDSVAWITEPSLLAAITIDIHSGTSPNLVEPGGNIRGRDLQSVFTAVNTLAAEMETIMERDIRPLLDAVADTSPRILSNLESVTSDLAVATEQVAILFDPENTEEVDGMITSLSGTSRNLEQLSAALESSLVRIDEMVASMDGLVSGNRDQIQGMLDDLSHTLASVARHVDTINANLESTSHNMNEFSRQIRRNPGVLVRGTSGGEDGSP
jgi:phospholipid/cholesterol/gamma-HCH transport system substrate-binding protein